MLNLSENRLPHLPDTQYLPSLQRVRLPAWHVSFRRLLLILLTIFVLAMFLPWTQTVQAEGKITSLRPEQRPQTVHATIAGRIEYWYIREGQFVHRGDTLVHLSEVKSEYFDPRLVERVEGQLRAKQNAADAYREKSRALQTQIGAMQRELESKMTQTRRKLEQATLKVTNDSLRMLQIQIDRQVAERQWNAAQSLYTKGLKSLTELEEKRLKYQESDTKLQAAQNQLVSSRNEVTIYRTELILLTDEYTGKIAKTDGDRLSALSDRYDAQATTEKLSIDRENYSRRQGFYYILAPQDGYVVQAIKSGIGEMVKEGDAIISIVPAITELAVEIYIRPIDLPLISPGALVRFTFDGWPAFFFSGWPGVSLGTFAGRVVTIDRNISANGRFRALVVPDPDAPSWPGALQVGGGAKGMALLNNVPLWYELWRILNGFPPDLYRTVNPGMGNPEKKK